MSQQVTPSGPRHGALPQYTPQTATPQSATPQSATTVTPASWSPGSGLTGLKVHGALLAHVNAALMHADEHWPVHAMLSSARPSLPMAVACQAQLRGDQLHGGQLHGRQLHGRSHAHTCCTLLGVHVCATAGGAFSNVTPPLLRPGFPPAPLDRGVPAVWGREHRGWYSPTLQMCMLAASPVRRGWQRRHAASPYPYSPSLRHTLGTHCVTGTCRAPGRAARQGARARGHACRGQVRLRVPRLASGRRV